MSGSAARDDIDEHIPGKWINVKSAFSWDGSALRGGSTKKTIATTGNTVGSIAVTGASLGTGTSSLAVAGAIAAGAAVSATGVGLVVVGGVLTLTSIATNATAMVKTATHVTHLKKISANLGALENATAWVRHPKIWGMTMNGSAPKCCPISLARRPRRR
jgi:hypothetical protein